jgi:nuclear pore complex protein Nup85
MLFSSADAYELLFRLQEVETAAAHGAGDDYLAILIRIAGVKGETDGLPRLRPVRLALARYMARCAVIGVGGKDYRPLLAPRPLAAAA